VAVVEVAVVVGVAVAAGFCSRSRDDLGTV